MPFIANTESQRREMLAELGVCAEDLFADIFADGFESGDLSAWSSSDP